MGSIENARCRRIDSNSVEVKQQRPLFAFTQFKMLWAKLSAWNHGSNCFHHLRLDICFDEYNSHDSLQVCLMLKLFNFRIFVQWKNVPVVAN